MKQIHINESKLIEELYMSFQLFLFIVFLSTAFPILNKNEDELTFQFSVVACIYIFAKMLIFINDRYISEKGAGPPSRLMALTDGILVGFFIYIQLLKGSDGFDFLYVYVVIQSLRYHTANTMVFSVFAISIHFFIIAFHDPQKIFTLEFLTSIALYCVMNFIISIPLRQLNVIRQDRTLIYDEIQKKNKELEKLASTD